MYNSRSINDLRPDVAANCRVWMALCRAVGLNVLITGTVRDKEYQEHCYRTGASKTPTPSFHAQGIGLAFDFCQNVKGKEYADLDFFRRAGEIGERMGFEWGGRWKSFPDRPHLQWSQRAKYTSSLILSGKRPPQMPLYEGEIDVNKEELEAMVKEAVRVAADAAKPKVYTAIDKVPEWARGLVRRALETGAIKGDGGGKLHLTVDNLVNLQMLDNLGLLDRGGK